MHEMGTSMGSQFSSILGETDLPKLETIYCLDMISNRHRKFVGRFTHDKCIVYNSP
jgi:hypothetical protein